MEGCSVIRQFVELLPLLPAMFNGSLRTEHSNSIYSTIYVKVRQVCLQTIYCGHGVVAVVPIEFMESHSYFNCGHPAARDSLAY